MIVRRSRLLGAGLVTFLLVILYHFLQLDQNGSNGDTSPWLRALRGDPNAFQIHLDGGLSGMVPHDGQEIYPIQIPMELPDASLGPAIQPIQFDFSEIANVGPQTERLKAVEDAFEHSWRGYKEHAWAKDELMPVTGHHRASFGNWAATLIDSLDTLWIMGRRQDFKDGLEAIKNISFSTPDALPINVFEVTIRYLGGLLGAYDVSEQQYPILLEKATEVGNMLMGAYDTYNRMPVTYWNKIYGEHASTTASIAELGSLSLEFTRLSQLTGNMKFFDAISRITECMKSQQAHTRLPGLFPHTVNAQDCKFNTDTTFSLGAFSDSAYEYLPKMYLLTNGSISTYRDMYLATLDPISSHILQRPMTPQNLDILLPATHRAYQPTPDTIYQMQHLSCFAGGMYALGSKLFGRPEDISIARRLTEGCIWAYNATPTNIMPEKFYFTPCPSSSSTSQPCKWNQTAYEERLWEDHGHQESSAGLVPFSYHLTLADQKALVINSTSCPPGITAISSATYRLRPEAIESIFILYRITGDPWLRDAAWDMFNAITTQTKTTYGYSSIADVTVPVSRGAGGDDDDEASSASSSSTGMTKKVQHKKLDRQETFWTAETLKYFWLIFADEKTISLDDWVFNTEAHPFRLHNG